MTNELWNEWLPLVVLCTAGLSLMLLLLVWIQGVKLRKLRRKYMSIMGESGVEQLDLVLSSMHDDMNRLRSGIEQHQRRIQELEGAAARMKSHVGIQRYNAFAEHGSELSFSVAWINDEQDGIVLTGIHGRDHSYVYAKPVEKGQSTYSLSPEEKQALEAAALSRGQSASAKADRD
ncbi:DUF4446 family protein [Paenibacillus thiaminolyticus]|uniref:DUF4446 family protein n=1 Tax=Paenibacillus thiaminolyticus TaxID=49283 RepID=A0AAP9DWE6_PANTH|nr:DUF4446 family protein [Paenibacillus thiaminolyticus]MCY9534883.1 DUF4446 family protein [Paenibacillus thiaminolyticus]MCY9604977.1 DUF4446 family protein [Paenibacillus thiaminolyticus]MCY9609113.1 DUF4446 family protein [Paenibacillus thiaminolyticus]MCY9616639.1 DUF4446 family protein [Paenibacillus thiaminolyticus]MCY9621687.1 DUF4446 family protein [Paenibacillus thiaminolyticus]